MKKDFLYRKNFIVVLKRVHWILNIKKSPIPSPSVEFRLFFSRRNFCDSRVDIIEFCGEKLYFLTIESTIFKIFQGCRGISLLQKECSSLNSIAASLLPCYINIYIKKYTLEFKMCSVLPSQTASCPFLRHLSTV